ncbi:MAG: hypothetical protein II816_04750 [Elusimicrobia bacterium]|nr:hypothetical protein [Elusimicrobiota bacterium]
MNFKKIFLLLLLTFFVFGFSACTKRGKLIDNAIVLQIEPAGKISMSVGDNKTLKAIIKNIKFEEVSHAVSWSISDSSLGSFSDSSAKETVFTAEATGTGTIKLSCEGYFVTADITIS